MKMQDLLENVARDICQALEDESAPDAWRKPWRAVYDASAAQVQSVDRRPYRGSNVLILGLTAMANTWNPAEPWGTYKAWARRGAQVRKGEKATPVVLWKWGERDNPKTGEKERTCFMTSYNVFHAQQVDNFDVSKWEKAPALIEKLDDYEPIEAAADLIVAWDNVGCPIGYGGNTAAYSPQLHVVKVPVMGAFKSAESFYSTVLHEIIHSTAKALKRDMSGGHGSEAYAKEELVAEIGSAMLCGVLGVHDLGHVEQDAHKAYIAGWVKVIKKDPKALMYACQKAQKAVDHVLKETGFLVEHDEQETAQAA